MENNLILVSLTDDQISKAKDKNGSRKRITHALVVGNHGTMFGTEKQCRKYYSAWSDIFIHLFNKYYETDQYEFKTFKCSGNVVEKLFNESDSMKPNTTKRYSSKKPKKKGFIARLFGL